MERCEQRKEQGREWAVGAVGSGGGKTETGGAGWGWEVRRCIGGLAAAWLDRGRRGVGGVKGACREPDLGRSKGGGGLGVGDV